MSYDEIIKYYLNLVCSQHSTKSKYMAWLEVLLRPFVEVIILNQAINNSFSLDTAVGKQLDIIGKQLNLSRQVNFQPTDGSSSILNDDYYRIILKAKVIKNQWKGTISNFYEYWNTLFGDSPLNIYLIDNQDMDYVGVTWDSTFKDQMMEDLISHGYIIPKPAGLGISYREINSEEVFGFDKSDFQPFNQGVFWQP